MRPSDEMNEPRNALLSVRSIRYEEKNNEIRLFCYYDKDK